MILASTLCLVKSGTLGQEGQTSLVDLMPLSSVCQHVVKNSFLKSFVFNFLILERDQSQDHGFDFWVSQVASFASVSQSQGQCS